ncbi:MAG: carboxypeptidase-like regulatory domain-containing protein [Bacteroidales bacterium]|jgi:hypothetical protein|nr:carboxypeptidase-like regulatory domain-containing protein [Bacteroidales bacterium]
MLSRANSYVNGLIFLLAALYAFLVPSGCVDTRGSLELRGRVTDSYTGEPVSGRNIIVEGLLFSGESQLFVDAGHFTSDSSGSFSYRIDKIDEARYYNFSFAGDSNYAFMTRRLGLMELQLNRGFLDFRLDRLVRLEIVIKRISDKPARDTLSLYWESGGINCWKLYPWEIYNYSQHINSNMKPGTELRWPGGFVSSTVRTRVFADKITRLHWHLDRYGKRLEIIDTITCKRDYLNTVYFTY